MNLKSHTHLVFWYLIITLLLLVDTYDFWLRGQKFDCFITVCYNNKYFAFLSRCYNTNKIDNFSVYKQ